MSMTAASIRAAHANNDPFPENYERVWQETWGHLAPQVRQVYAGKIVFTLGVHGDITIIDWDFALADGTQLDGSPWLYQDMHDKVGDWIERKGNLRGGIWTFEGTFERLKNGRSRWSGPVRPMRLAYRFNSKTAPKRARRARKTAN